MIGKFEDKGIYKIDQEGLTASMHYIYADGKYYSLTLGGSEKVQRLNNNENLKVIFTSKSNETKNATALIIDNKEIVRNFFDRMFAINFCHFKEFHDDLVIMQIKI